MAVGSLAANGPTLKIEVFGAVGQTKSFECLIDTGFTGFLMMPLLQAFPLGLPLVGAMPVTFANSTTEEKLIALGSVRIDGQEQLGTIILEPGSSEVLIGMDFLKKFGLKLIVCPTNLQVEVVRAESNFTIPAGLPAPPLKAISSSKPSPN